MHSFPTPILVTRPYLPDLEEFKKGCEEIWANKWLTNDGPVLQRFHKELAAYLGVPETNLALFNNGTLALELGYYAMGLSGGDVITTPFTFVATSHALKRIGATPIFADVDPETLCLDPRKVEKLITPRTKAIVPVHVYGNVCDIEGFNRLSEKYGIPVIYDAAHAFGVKIDHHSPTPTLDSNSSCSLAACGDMSMFSFHPTKLFHSCEGGCLVFGCQGTGHQAQSTRPHHSPTPTTDSNFLQQKLFELRDFAIKSETECTDVGSNAKMNELQALMGLCCLRKIDDLLAYRQQVYSAYSEVFNSKKTDIRCSPSPSTFTSPVRLLPHSANKAYVPVLFDSFATRERVYTELKKCNVFARRYFYPVLTDFAPYVYARGTCPIAEDIASRVLTLPTYYGLPLDDVRAIAKNVLEIVSL